VVFKISVKIKTLRSYFGFRLQTISDLKFLIKKNEGMIFTVTESYLLAVSKGENILQLKEPSKFLPLPYHDWKL